MRTKRGVRPRCSRLSLAEWIGCPPRSYDWAGLRSSRGLAPRV
jgi:hypothetical protein